MSLEIMRETSWPTPACVYVYVRVMWCVCVCQCVPVCVSVITPVHYHSFTPSPGPHLPGALVGLLLEPDGPVLGDGVGAVVHAEDHGSGQHHAGRAAAHHRAQERLAPGEGQPEGGRGRGRERGLGECGAPTMDGHCQRAECCLLLDTRPR